MRDGLFGGFRHAERRGDFIDKTVFFNRRLDLDNGADFIHNRFFVDEIQDVFRPGARQRFDISRLISFSVFLQRVADGFFGNDLLFGERRDDFLDFVDFAFLVVEIVLVNNNWLNPVWIIEIVYFIQRKKSTQVGKITNYNKKTP